MKRRVRKVYKKLPPHSNEAHPVARAGEVSKPLIIGIIAIVAVIILSFLLLFSKQFVGKAIELNANTAGAELNAAKVYSSQAFSMNISANTQNEVNLVNLTVALPMGVNCTQVSIASKLQGWNVFQNQCLDNKIYFVSVALGVDVQIAKGPFDAAQLTVLGLPKASYTFDLSFEAYDSSNQNVITQVTDPKVDIVDSVCGDNDKAPSEQCDDGNTVTEYCKYGEKSCQVCAFDCKLGAGQTSYCGDNKYDKDNGENCDGSDLRGETCINQGHLGGTLACAADCKSFDAAMCTKQAYQCTGAVPENSQLCSGSDLGLSKDTIRTIVSQCAGNKCEYACAGGYTFHDGVCIPQQQPQAICGNGMKEGTEQCDDGNLANGDGCSSACMVEQQQVVSVTGKKIILTDVTAANNVFSTKITATETFANEITVYTILYNANDKVLSIKSEKVEGGLAKDAVYTAAVNYPEANVKKKSVIVYDLEQNPSVFGQLQVQKS